jgi:uncharacterized protein YwgA
MIGVSATRESKELAMEPRFAALKLFLDELGIPSDIRTISSRKRLQKAVYLGQVSSPVDLGYRFGWYLRGPYSTELAKAYYGLAEAEASGESPSRDLRPDLKAKLRDIRPLFKVPNDVALSQPDWLELLASVHYLRKVRELDDAKMTNTIRAEKAALLPYLPQARTVLTDAQLL